MKVIRVRNVHEALVRGLEHLSDANECYTRDSRNGPVIVSREPVVTEYLKPMERYMTWPQRDANPFFHLYESIWMLLGRNDLAPLRRYVKDFGQFSDDGQTLHGAYGFRWRRMFSTDQLETIADRLRANPDDRRCVLEMWSAVADLWQQPTAKDVPCNLTATFQRDAYGALELTVFCRSNDAIWGAYGANAVHFSVLQEYVARMIGCEVGIYRQISVNFHAYQERLRALAGRMEGTTSALASGGALMAQLNPYTSGTVPVAAVPMPWLTAGHDQRVFDGELVEVSRRVDTGFTEERGSLVTVWAQVAARVLRAHAIAAETWSSVDIGLAMKSLADDFNTDIGRAAYEWLARRHQRAVAKERS